MAAQLSFCASRRTDPSYACHLHALLHSPFFRMLAVPGELTQVSFGDSSLRRRTGRPQRPLSRWPGPPAPRAARPPRQPAPPRLQPAPAPAVSGPLRRRAAWRWPPSRSPCLRMQLVHGHHSMHECYGVRRPVTSTWCVPCEARLVGYGQMLVCISFAVGAGAAQHPQAVHEQTASKK